MPNCCSNTSQSSLRSNKYNCPANGKLYNQVELSTILHHIKEPWNFNKTEQIYYFCDDPACDVVYFGKDNSVIKKTELRTPIGIKEQSDNTLICYCFGVSKIDAKNNPMIKKFVLEKTKEKLCSCKVRNPSGKCCLKDFP